MAYTTINKPNSYFNTLLYTGNGSTLTVTGNSFQPDFTWIKERSAAGNHKLADVVRGTSKYLSSNLTDAEDSTGSAIQSWNSTGFSLSNATDINDSGQTYAAWNWLASNTSGSSNTAGSITSTVAANTTAGFSIVTYTGAGGASTVGHGLGVIPRMIILKGRSNARIWVIGHGSLGWTKYMSFDTAAVETNNYWNDTTPTSTVFSIFNSANVNGSGETYVAYCFAQIKGYSKFGSYTGNGNANGTFVYTGFKPAFIMLKRTDSTSSWAMYDNKRNTYNVMNIRLLANTTGADDTSADNNIDFVSNGIKFRTSVGWNASGASYIYMAFAENPFVSSTQIPTTAR